jgi:hypothetical protein
MNPAMSFNSFAGRTTMSLMGHFAQGNPKHTLQSTFAKSVVTLVLPLHSDWRTPM